jgi:hypothetical protein
VDEPLEIPQDILDRNFPEGFTLRDEANAIVAWAFRNGPLQKLHAGEHSKLLEDESLSRITDAEMKELILSACEHIELLLLLKQNDPRKYDFLVKTWNIMFCNKWDR